MKTFWYNLYGIKLESELELPELIVDYTRQSEVVVKLGQVPTSLFNDKSTGNTFQVFPNDFIYRHGTIGSFRVQNGKSITVQPKKSAYAEEVRLILLGSIMGSLMHQRSILPIHGSTITANSKATIFAGKSSIGKSTLAAGFIKKGYQILSDDIAAITKNENDKLIVHPGIPQLKLWKDTIDYFDLSSDIERVRPNADKYIKTLTSSFSNEPQEISKILVININRNNSTNHKLIKGSEKLNLLIENTYRRQFIAGTEMKKRYFRDISYLAQSTELHEVSRPSGQNLIYELSNYIENTFFNL